MARTTAEAVQGVLARNYDPEVLVDPFIDSANATVSRVITCASKRGVSISTTEAELIERWLAAYYYTAADPLYMSRSTGRASGSFQRAQGEGIDGNDYGIRAVALDPSGCLRAILKGNRVQFKWGGKSESEQVSYKDRN